MGESRLNSSLSPRRGEILLQSDSGLDFSEFSCDNLLKVGLPRIRFKGFTDIVMVPGYELVERISSSYADVGMDETMVVTRSNKRANVYNQGIRATVLDREDELCTGDLLMVVKNNYLWGADTVGFIANGDTLEVLELQLVEEVYGLTFAHVLVRLIDYPAIDPFEAILLLDTLTSPTPSLTYEEQNNLYREILQEYNKQTGQIAPLNIRIHPYYNALQVKYAYAITCHKSQGGQWEQVFVEKPFLPEGQSVAYFRWLYTAITRAKEKLYLVNFPEEETIL